MTSERQPSDAKERGLANLAATKRRIGFNRHDLATIRAGAKRLVRVLRPFGVMQKSTLKREAGAEHWHDYEFERALRAAVSAGAIRRLPFGFYATTDDTDRALQEHGAKMGREVTIPVGTSEALSGDDGGGSRS